MDGESKFNEVFFDGAEVGDDALIGEVGQGWAIAIVTLGRERLTLGSQAVAMFRLHERMVEAARERDLLDPVLARSMTKLWARMWLLRFTWQRAIDDGRHVVGGFSVLKLMTSETDRDLGDMATEVLGTDACVDPAGQTNSSTICWSVAPRRSSAAPARSSATFWASGCSGSPKSHGDNSVSTSLRFADALRRAPAAGYDRRARRRCRRTCAASMTARR